MRPQRARWAACRHGLRAAALVLAGVLASAPVRAAVTAADAGLVRALYAGWYLPRATAFTDEGTRLAAVLDRLCRAGPQDEPGALAAARAQWRQLLTAWEELSAVRGGALLSRRTPRAIDFMPTRPLAIERAVRSEPADVRVLERIGTPAKGLPALEWLLWGQPARADSPHCRYARQLALEVEGEGRALQQAFGLALQQGWDEEELDYALYEFLNLFDAGLQKLWWEDIERPRHQAAGRRAVFSRDASGTSVHAWRVRWHALRLLAVGARGVADPGRAPDGAAQEPPSLHAHLLAVGRPDTGRRLLPLVAAVDEALGALDDPTPLHLDATVVALKALQHFLEADVADALQYVISFFDEDGD